MINKHLLRGCVLLAIVILINIELPYGDKSFIEYILPSVSIFNSDKLDTSTTHLSGITSLIVSIWACVEIWKGKRIRISGFALGIIILYIILPLGMGAAQYINTPIYYFGNGIKSIHVSDSDISINDFNDEYQIRLILDMAVYDENLSPTTISLVLPTEMQNYFEESTVTIIDRLHSQDKSRFTTGQTVTLTLKDGVDLDMLIQINLDTLDYKLVLNDGYDELVWMRNDSY